MRRHSVLAAAVASGLLLFASCAQTDLGSPCQLLTTSNQQISPVPNENIVQSGNGACEQFICISFDGKSPMCSDSCVQEGAACSNGLVCQPALLTPALLTLLQQRTGGPTSAEYQQLTSGLTDSLYCGPRN